MLIISRHVLNEIQALVTLHVQYIHCEMFRDVPSVSGRILPDNICFFLDW